MNETFETLRSEIALLMDLYINSLPCSVAIHYTSPYKSGWGVFKQAIQFVYLSWSCCLYLTDVTYTKSHMFSF